VSPVKYELGFYIPEDAILHGHRRENLKSVNSPDELAVTRPLKSSALCGNETSVAVFTIAVQNYTVAWMSDCIPDVRW
jgi:hypothetical protein